MKQAVDVLELYSNRKAQWAWLESYGFIDFYDNTSEKIVIPIEIEKFTQYNIPEIADNYAFKGGTARMMLAVQLGLPTHQSRDFDLIYMGDEQDYGYSQKINAELNPDDHFYNHVVEQYRSDYFETRDFSCNEIVATKKHVTLSVQGLIANYYGLVVPGSHILKQRNLEDSETLLPHMMTKALRFLALYQSLGYASTQIVYPEKFEFPVLDSFHIALHLDRARAVGPEVVGAYIKNLVLYKAISPILQDAHVLREYLSWDTDYEFQYFTEQ